MFSYHNLAKRDQKKEEKKMMKARALINGIVPGTDVTYLKGNEYKIVEIDHSSKTNMSLCISIGCGFSTNLQLWVNKYDFEVLED